MIGWIITGALVALGFAVLIILAGVGMAFTGRADDRVPGWDRHGWHPPQRPHNRSVKHGSGNGADGAGRSSDIHYGETRT